MIRFIRQTNLTNLVVNPVLSQQSIRTINTTSCVFAARKGIRIARQKAAMLRSQLRRKERVKLPWVHPKFRVDTSLTSTTKKRYTDIGKPDQPKDNVFFMDNFKELDYSIEEAIDLHKEVLDKTILNEPDALMYAKIELNLRLKKRTKFLKSFHGVFLFPNDYFFKRTNRIVAICKDDSDIEMCNKSGVQMAGSKELIKLIKAKELKEVEYDYIICHNDMLLQLAESKKYLGDRFPGPYLNNFGASMEKLVNRFVNGLTYKLVADLVEQDYGFVYTHFGRANMTNEQLKENLLGLLKEILRHKPEETDHPLITRVLIQAPPNDEQFKIRHWEYLGLDNPYISEVKQHEKDLKDREEEKRKAAKKKNK